MNDADALTADLCDRIHRQHGYRRGQWRKGPRRSAQRAHDLVGALDVGVIDVIRIRASTAGITRTDRQLSFHIAAQRDVFQYFDVDGFKGDRIDVEPVEITVEYQRRLDRFGRCQCQNRCQRRYVAVKTADDVNRFGMNIRLALKR